MDLLTSNETLKAIVGVSLSPLSLNLSYSVFFHLIELLYSGELSLNADRYTCQSATLRRLTQRKKR